MIFSIIIEKLEFETIIGILPLEREKTQKILVEGIFEYESQEFLDYVVLKDMIKNLFIKNQYLLLEDAIQDVAKHLKKHFSCLKSIEMSIKKLEILQDCIVGIKTKIIF